MSQHTRDYARLTLPPILRGMPSMVSQLPPESLPPRSDLDESALNSPVTVEWHTTRGPATTEARDFSVHVGLVDRGSPDPTSDSIDPLHFLISDAIDVVSNTGHLRRGSSAKPSDDKRLFDELTERALQAVCKTNLEQPFVLKKLKAPKDGEAHTWTRTDNDGSTFMREPASESDKPSEVACLARPKWYHGQTATLDELTNNLNNTASYLKKRSEGISTHLSPRSIQLAEATASVLGILEELKPNAASKEQWKAMRKWKGKVPAWKPEESSDGSQMIEDA